MTIECLDGIPCPKHTDNPCCHGCADYEICDFEDKCFLHPQTCGNEDYKTLAKERQR